MNADNFATTGQDWANYISHELDSNGMICLVALLNGQPDADILQQAVKYSVELQPVLGCTFDTAKEPPVWMSVNETSQLFSVMKADTFQEGIAGFLQDKPMQAQLAVRLITCPNHSVICLRLDHAAADGAGAKQYLALLNRLYNVLAAGEKLPESIPHDRSDMQLFAACGIKDFRMALRKENPSAGPFITFPYQNSDGQEVEYAFLTFPLKKVKAVPGSTVNDLLLAACARALAFEMKAEQPVMLNMTVDLRRYLQEDDAKVICNLSGMEKVYFAVSLRESFEETAGRAAKETATVKAGLPGIHSAASMAYLRMMPFEKARMFLLDASSKSKAAGIAVPIVSNLGWLYEGSMCFGNVRVTEILPFTPAMHAPSFMLGAGSYGDNITLSAGYYEGEREKETIERFLQRVRNEMTGKD